MSVWKRGLLFAWMLCALCRVQWPGGITPKTENPAGVVPVGFSVLLLGCRGLAVQLRAVFFQEGHFRSTDDAGIVAEHGGQNFQAFEVRGVHLFFHVLAQGGKEQVSGFCHAAADDEGIRIQDVMAGE